MYLCRRQLRARVIFATALREAIAKPLSARAVNRQYLNTKLKLEMQLFLCAGFVPFLLPAVPLTRKQIQPVALGAMATNSLNTLPPYTITAQPIPSTHHGDKALLMQLLVCVIS